MLKPLFSLALAACSLAAPAQTLTIDAAKATADINPAMYGIFFEDINLAADGGLYAELLKNRSFDFPQPLTGWRPFGNVETDDTHPAYPRNPRYVRLINDGRRSGSGIENEGFRNGIGLKKDADYRFTATVRAAAPAKIRVEMIDSRNNNPMHRDIDIDGAEWHKITELLRAPFTDAHSTLRIFCLKGTVEMDHVSLMPTDTWRGRENGLRRDLAQALFDLQPGVMRFPGGCIVEGNTLASRYQWKNSVGPVENRPLNENRWNYGFKNHFYSDYFQSYGLGFFEFFQLCEDMGSEPLPVLSCGLACQFESKERVPVDSLQPFIDDALDLIEFANGPVTTKWGKLRADMGHAAPFGLKMIGIGNEQWGKVYPERLEPFIKAIRAKYPEMKIVGTSGPNAEGKEFDYLWPEMKRLGADLVDEHYYRSPEWFLSHANRYDNYDRKGPKVFAGEYACHDKKGGLANNWRSALYEAAFMTGIERNADVVRLATYAPLFAHVDGWQWKPDMIWYDNLRMTRTPNYYVQQLYAQNKGTGVLRTALADAPAHLYASAVEDSRTREIVVKVANATDTVQTVRVQVNGLKRRALDGGLCIYMQADDLATENSLDAETLVPRTRPVQAAGTEVQLALPKHFFGVVRLRTKAAK